MPKAILVSIPMLRAGIHHTPPLALTVPMCFNSHATRGNSHLSYAIMSGTNLFQFPCYAREFTHALIPIEVGDYMFQFPCYAREFTCTLY